MEHSNIESEHRYICIGKVSEYLLAEAFCKFFGVRVDIQLQPTEEYDVIKNITCHNLGPVMLEGDRIYLRHCKGKEKLVEIERCREVSYAHLIYLKNKPKELKEALKSTCEVYPDLDVQLRNFSNTSVATSCATHGQTKQDIFNSAQKKENK